MNEADIAIVGCGPRGLFALEQLLLRFGNDASARPVRIHLFDTTEFFGAGPVYDPCQPDYARMNFPNSEIDAWSEESHRLFPGTRLRLTDWLRRDYPHLADDHGFTPRAIVGEYLHECFHILLGSAPSHVTILPERSEVRRVARSEEEMWIVESPTSRIVCEEVLLATGHEGWRSPETDVHDESANDAQYISCVFPLEEKLTPEVVAPGAEVAVKGFALTWIDVALALTEGRGGRFEGESPHDYTYQASGGEPGKLFPHSRTGRPMLAKPLRHRMNLPDGLDSHWREHRGRMEKKGELAFPRFSEDIHTPFFAAANAALEMLGKEPSCEEWFDDWLRQSSRPEPVYERMRESVEVSCGLREPGPAWALAEAWRKLYPPISRRASNGKLQPQCWSSFIFFAVEMERIAFGPPAENLGRILALIDAGFVDLSDLAGSMPFRRIRIDARIPPPKAIRPGSPVERLLEEGVLRRVRSDCGVQVDRSARPLDERGLPVNGLAIVGRATEGCVIGNDTLSRTLHPHLECWARSVLANCRQSKTPAPIAC